LVREKLVRDKIPDLIRNSGGTPSIRVAENQELDYFIRLKVQEEANELFESGDNEEIVDLLEIIDALLTHRGFSREKIDEMKKDKVEERGKFDMGIILSIDD
jgi:predicted house-cleaning noncanonical NTP pyrophosphatase (MazG superfamily)